MISVQCHLSVQCKSVERYVVLVRLVGLCEGWVCSVSVAMAALPSGSLADVQ